MCHLLARDEKPCLPSLQKDRGAGQILGDGCGDGLMTYRVYLNALNLAGGFSVRGMGRKVYGKVYGLFSIMIININRDLKGIHLEHR